jgi:cobalt/nickel transport protein
VSTTPTQRRVPLRFFVGFGLVALLIAGLVSYLASSSPDGLDSVVLDGCTESGEQLTGDCIAQNADEHALEEGPLAGYTVGGDEGLLGVSGIIGVLATLLVAGGLFWLLRPRRGRDPGPG